MNTPRLRIAFFGLPLAGELLARDGHDLVFAALCRSDAPGTRRLGNRLGPERVRIRPDVNSPSLASAVETLAPDLVVSWFWTTRLPMRVVLAARLGGIGVHPSLLPRHRGPDPTYWAIASGDTETGVTVHRLEKDYDTGAVLSQETLAIDPAWNAWQLAKALDRPSLRALRATVARFARGERVEELSQDERSATLAPFPSDEDAAIRWTWPTAQVLRHIRALAPAPGAWTEMIGRALVITHAEAAVAVPRGLAPGEGVAMGGRLVIGTADGAVSVLGGEIDGEEATSAALLALVVQGS